jgi:hypothetical protein
MSWLSLTAEAKVHVYEQSSIVQSLAVSTGWGYPLFNATFVPLDLHVLFFHGSSHIDATVGVNVQTRYNEPDDVLGFRDLKSSLLNPTASLSYRFEPESGGFTFRIGLVTMYAVNDLWWIPSGVVAYGWTF